MDWTKAKTILIVALLITNLVLLATWFSQGSRFETDAKEMEEVTISLLEDKGIYIETAIPKERPRMGSLTVQYDTVDKEKIDQLLAQQKPIAQTDQTDENYRIISEAFIEAAGLMTENVTFSHIASTGVDTQVFYKNYINDIPIEDSYIICTIREGKLIGFERYWLNPIKINDIEREVTPALAALIRFMTENAQQEEIHVQEISLVYWLDSSVIDTESPITDTAFPAWKIIYNRGEVSHIMAWEQ